VTTFLSQYLLAAQGDRPAMAHSVEGRFPFLDYRVVEICTRLPSRLKLNGLTEKYLLRQVAKEWLPAEILSRGKRAYRAPIHRSFFNDARLDYVHELLQPEAIRSSGLFNPAAVSQLAAKAEHSPTLGEADSMALVGVISTQLIHRQFVTQVSLSPAIGEAERIKIVDRCPK